MNYIYSIYFVNYNSRTSVPNDACDCCMCELVGEDRFRRFKVQVLAKHEYVSFREAGLDLLLRGLKRAGLDARNFRNLPQQ
jgi:hypothetical protein